MTPPVRRVRLADTCRLVPSLFPTVGILDALTTPDDLPHLFELESWSNDRISTELGVLRRIPREEWVMGRPMASVVMAAFCHSRAGGGRFNGPERGAWYAGITLDTAQAEVVYHRTAELAEVGVFETRLQMRLYLADFHTSFHDLRRRSAENALFHDPSSYAASQELARQLLEGGSNGVLYRSVRKAGGECVACFRPALVTDVRPDAGFEYRWEGGREPNIRRL